MTAPQATTSRDEAFTTAETSVETATRIYQLTQKVAAFDAADVPATPAAFSPIRDKVVQLSEEVVAEAAGWKAMLRDKNVPFA